MQLGLFMFLHIALINAELRYMYVFLIKCIKSMHSLKKKVCVADTYNLLTPKTGPVRSNTSKGGMVC